METTRRGRAVARAARPPSAGTPPPAHRRPHDGRTSGSASAPACGRRSRPPTCRVAQATDAQDADVARVDDRREEVDAVGAERGDGEGRALELVQRRSSRTRQRSATSRVARASSGSDSRSASRITGTMSPPGTATARPMWIRLRRWISLSMIVALRMGCWRSARAAARTTKSLRLGTGTPRAAYCSFISARRATTASIDTSKPWVSWAISVRLCCIRAAMVPRMPFIGMIDAVSWPAAACSTGEVGRDRRGGRGHGRGDRRADVAARHVPRLRLQGGDVDPRLARITAGQRGRDLARAGGDLRLACCRLLDVLRHDAASGAGARDAAQVDTELVGDATGVGRDERTTVGRGHLDVVGALHGRDDDDLVGRGGRRARPRALRRPEPTRPRRAASRGRRRAAASCRRRRRGRGCPHPRPRRRRRSCRWPGAAAACPR